MLYTALLCAILERMAKTKPILRRCQKERTELTRLRLLEAAEAVFIRDGFQAAKIEDIAKVAGYTRGAFYANFRSKEDLFHRGRRAPIERSDRQAAHRGAILSRQSIRNRKPCSRLFKRAPPHDAGHLLLLEFDLFFLRQPSLKKRVRPMQARLLSGIKAVFRDLYDTANRKPPVSLTAVGLGFGAIFQGLTLQKILNGKLVSSAEVAAVLNRYIDAMLSA